jgi:hypothetical protein
MNLLIAECEKIEKFCNELLSEATRWGKPDWTSEAEELSMQMDSGVLKIPGMSKNQVWKLMVTEGKLVTLSDDLWKRMENTDSWETDSLEKAETLALEYDKDLDVIVSGLQEESEMPAPVVIIKPDGTPHLLGGNTRLMACKALGVRPKVWLLNLAITDLIEGFAFSLMLSEADIKQLSPYLFGFKAFELAYNKCREMGLLHGAALNLELMIKSSEKTNPILSRSKNSYRLQAGDAVPTKPSMIVGHDMIHMLTTNMAIHFTPKVDPRKPSTSPSSKFNESHFKNRALFSVIDQMNQKSGVNIDNFLRKHLFINLRKKIQNRQGTVRGIINTILSDLSNLKKDKLSAEEQAKAVKVYKMLNELNEHMRMFDNAHYIKDYKMTYNPAKNTLDYSLNTETLPQYDAEEDAGNVLVGTSREQIQDVDRQLGPFVHAIQTSSYINDAEVRKIINDISQYAGTGVFRDNNTKLFHDKITKVIDSLIELIPDFCKKYNYYLKLLKNMGAKNGPDSTV